MIPCIFQPSITVGPSPEILFTFMSSKVQLAYSTHIGADRLCLGPEQQLYPCSIRAQKETKGARINSDCKRKALKVWLPPSSSSNMCKSTFKEIHKRDEIK